MRFPSCWIAFLGAGILAAQPRLGWVTQIGGSGADNAAAIGRDTQGNLYVAGSTLSPDLPANGCVALNIDVGFGSSQGGSALPWAPGADPARGRHGPRELDTCTDTRYNTLMVRTFRHRGLKRLFQDGDASKVRADQIKRITDVLAHLDTALRPADIDLPGYRLHPLKGDLKGLWSVSISGNSRIVFRLEDGDVFDVDLVDYH